MAAGSPAQAGFPLISAPTIGLTVAATRNPADPRLIARKSVKVILRASRVRSIYLQVSARKKFGVCCPDKECSVTQDETAGNP
jgi:hypothetical protein